MAGSKKYGSFAGVFTPSLLTILGVIMYMRLGWVVGNAGLWGTLIIIFIAHIISFTTGLSISSIATDKKVGAGGVYYVLSRSLGMPIGGAIGLTLFVGTAFSIALYLIGFSESFNAYLGLDISLDGYRITAGIALLILTILAFISTSIALKVQFFILLAIILSLVSIFMGDKSVAPETISSFGDGSSVPFETVFAIFFPAVTGFTAGIAMSGDLKDPKKAIPTGTMASIIVGLLVYVFLAIFIAYTIDPELLKSDNTILIKIAWFSPLVVAGIWGATLSSALGGILGGPRILQAMSLDKITPKFFAKGTGKNKEPRLALIFTVILAGSGILIGELNMIARIVSMFYLAAYGFINLSFFLESWASSDFRPSFKVNKWIGFVGFIVTFIIMFKLDMFAMLLAFIIIGGIYFWLSRKEFSAGEGDVWQSVWTNIIKRGLRTLTDKEEHKRNWKPNILLFSGKSNARQYLLEFSRFLTGKTGIVTNFDLTVNKEPGELFSKEKQNYHDDLLEKYGVFGRQMEVNNLYTGIETIASVFGFSGIDPNTVLMGWAKNSKDPVSFARMTNKLMKLDYNVLYLDYDKQKGFGEYKTIDLWWRGISRNAELTLMLVKSLVLSQEWRRAKVRIILVNNTGDDQHLIKKRIEHLIISFRVVAEVFIINNYTENKSIFELMKIHSGSTDLIMLGIPDIREGEEKGFVKNVNNLVDILGTTLLVKASSEFGIADLGIHKQEISKKASNHVLFLPPLFKPAFEDELIAIEELEKDLANSSPVFESEVINPVVKRYLEIAAKLKHEIVVGFDDNAENVPGEGLMVKYSGILKEFGNITEELDKKDTHLLYELMKSGIDDYLSNRKKVIERQDKTLMVRPDDKELIVNNDDPEAIKRIKENLLEKKESGKEPYFNVKWKKAIEKCEEEVAYKEIYSLMLYFLDNQYEVLLKFSRDLNVTITSFVEKYIVKRDSDLKKNFEDNVTKLFDKLQKDLSDLNEKSIQQLEYINRLVVNELSLKLTNEKKGGNFLKNNSKKKGYKQVLSNIINYPDLWYQTIEPCLSGVEICFSLNSFYLKMLDETEKIKLSIQENTTQNIEKLFPDIDKLLDKLTVNPEDINDFSLKINDLNIEEFMLNENKILDHLYSFLESHIRYFPENADVLTKETHNDIIKKQINEIETVSLPVDKIVKYIISSSYILPLKDKLKDYNNSLKDIKMKLSSVINMLNYISGSSSNEKSDDTINMLEKVKDDFTQMKDEYYYKSAEFYEYLIQILHQLNLSLDLENIRDNISEFNKFINKDKKGAFGKYLKNVNETIKLRTNKISGFIANKKAHLKMLEYYSENEKYLPEHIRLKTKISKFKPDNVVLKNLPFYYLQLFKGNRFSLPGKNEIRESELNEAVKSIENNSEGGAAFLVTGASGIGKSWFLENLAGELSVSQPVYLNILEYIERSKFPLKQLISDISGRNGNLTTIINKYPVGTVFVIEDIENYISVKEGERFMLDVLSELIDRFGNKFYFLFSANINSLKIIEESSKLLNSISSMTVLNPLPDKSIEKILSHRHEMGNLTLYSKKGNELSHKNIHDVIFRIINIADGNPGIAMSMWLSFIKYDNERFYMELNKTYEDVEIENTNWLSLLQRLMIFGNISKEEFKYEQGDFIQRNIKLLEKTGLVTPIRKDSYKIDEFLKPFVERWLKNKEII